jgi:hypothetical protein
MRYRWLRPVRAWLATFLIVFILAAPALAQDDDEKKPFREPGIRYLEHRKPYVEWLAGSVIIIACLLIAFKNPHRSHLD